MAAKVTVSNSYSKPLTITPTYTNTQKSNSGSTTSTSSISTKITPALTPATNPPAAVYSKSQATTTLYNSSGATQQPVSKAPAVTTPQLQKRLQWRLQ